jgi:hypothetical protein
MTFQVTEQQSFHIRQSKIFSLQQFLPCDLILKIASLFVLEVGPFFMTPMMLTGVLGF